ncbi:penicillin-binding protein 2, partial [Desulfovibrio oxamicus]|nr:penicillin-binding protein 2 [Nitratidesulfovibrio oxamicus]
VAPATSPATSDVTAPVQQPQSAPAAPASRQAAPATPSARPDQGVGAPVRQEQQDPQERQDQLDRQDEGLRTVPTSRSARSGGRDRAAPPEIEDAREGLHRYDPDTFDPDATTPDGRGGDDGVVPPLRRFPNVAPEDGQ